MYEEENAPKGSLENHLFQSACCAINGRIRLRQLKVVSIKPKAHVSLSWLTDSITRMFDLLSLTP